MNILTTIKNIFSKPQPIVTFDYDSYVIGRQKENEEDARDGRKRCGERRDDFSQRFDFAEYSEDAHRSENGQHSVGLIGDELRNDGHQDKKGVNQVPYVSEEGGEPMRKGIHGKLDNKERDKK